LKATVSTLWSRVVRRSVTELTRVACVLALLGLFIMVYPLLFPGALTVVLSMGLGHTLGIAAFACYLLAVIVDLAQRRAD
jgi:hypothetical protein